MDRTLDPDFIFSFRVFAYQVGNGTFAEECREYNDLLRHPSAALGVIFEAELCRRRRSDPAAVDRAVQWLRACVEKPGVPEAAPAGQSLPEGHPHRVIADFAYDLGWGRLCPEILDNTDYLPAFVDELGWGSQLELAMVILCNNIRLDANGMVCNREHAVRRVAQYIRGWLDEGYAVEPGLTEAETNLW